MKSMANASQTSSVSRSIVTDQALRVLASSIFRQLQEEGCEPRDIISVSSQLIDLVTSELTKDDDQRNS